MSLAHLMGRTLGPASVIPKLQLRAAPTSIPQISSIRSFSSLNSTRVSSSTIKSRTVTFPFLHSTPSRSITTVLSRKLQESRSRDLPPPQLESEGFAALGVYPEFTQLLQSQGIVAPTGVQELAIPKLLQGLDGAVGAQTGTGKTLSFVLPIVQQLVRDEKEAGYVSRPSRPRALIIVPSRELALQVVAVAKSLCHHPDARFRAAAVVGGESKLAQRQLLKGEDNFRATKAKHVLAKREKTKVVELAVAAGKVARAFGVEKAASRRVANKAAWDMYLEHVGRCGGSEVETSAGESLQAVRARGYELALAVGTGKMALTVPFTAGADAVATAVARVVNAHDDVASEAEIQAQVQAYFAEKAAPVSAEAAAAALDVEEEVGAQIDELGEVDEEITYDDDTDVDVDALYSELVTPADHGSSKPTPEQILRQNRNVDLLVGTPGRIRQLLDEQLLFLSEVRYVAVDEADFMFHPVAGFTEELSLLFAPIRKRLNNHFIEKYGFAPRSALQGTELVGGNSVRRMEETQQKLKEGSNVITTNVFNTQLIFAGASLGAHFMRLVKAMFPLYTEPRYTRPLLQLETEANLCLPRNLQQTWVRVGSRDKLDILTDLLAAPVFKVHEDPNHVHQSSVMIFCNSIASCRAVQHHLVNNGIAAVGSHGEIPPRLRKQYWSEFLEKKRAVMVATDLSARGIDTRFLSRVINFDFPLSPVDYLHRAGRTARANEAGHVINLLVRGDEVLAKAIDNAHKEGKPITTLSADKECYRTDVARELRKDAELMGVSRRQIIAKKREKHTEEAEKHAEMREARRNARNDERLKRELMSLPWQRRANNVAGRKVTEGGVRGTVHTDFDRTAKKQALKRVVRDVKWANTGKKHEKVDKTSDRRQREQEEIAKKTRFARAKGADGPILSKTQSIKTMMSDKAIREKIEYTMKTQRYKAYKQQQREDAKPAWQKRGFYHEKMDDEI